MLNDGGLVNGFRSLSDEFVRPGACSGRDRIVRWEFKMRAERFCACGGNPRLFLNSYSNRGSERISCTGGAKLRLGGRGSGQVGRGSVRAEGRRVNPRLGRSLALPVK